MTNHRNWIGNSLWPEPATEWEYPRFVKPFEDCEMEQQAKAIVDSLGEDEAATLLRIPLAEGWFIFTYWSDRDHTGIQRLQRLGLLDWAAHWNARWNDLGLACRALLQSQEVKS